MSYRKSIKSIKEHLDSCLFGQDDAKKKVALALDIHINNVFSDDYYKYKVNTLLTGPSGSGKTEMVQALASYINMPFYHIDCSRLSMAGFKGNSIDEALAVAISPYEEVNHFERGILFLDEIDKLCNSAGDGVQTKVQFELLRVIEGTEIKLNSGKIISTKNMMIIAAGAFSSARTGTVKKTISMTEEPENQLNFLKISRQTLIDSGLAIELLGRLHNLCELEAMTRAQLIDVIKNKEIKGFFKQISYIEKDVYISDMEINKIADMVMAMGLGVRGARPLIYAKVVEKLTMYSVQDISELTGVRKLRLSGVKNSLVSLDAGEDLMKQGEINLSIFIMIEGSLSVIKDEKIVKTLEPGCCLGELSAFGNGVSKVTLKASEPCKFAEFKVADIISQLSQDDFTFFVNSVKKLTKKHCHLEVLKKEAS